MADEGGIRLGGSSIDGPSSLKSTFTFTRRARPPSKKALDKEGRIPLASGPAPIQLAHKESKGGLRAIFTRNKVDVDPNMSPLMEDFVPQGRPRSPPPSEVGGKPETHQSFLRPFPLRASVVPSSQTQDKSKMLASKPAKPTKQSVKTTPKTAPKQSPRTPRRTDAAWDPPPLFQAYPQAIKHALLSASTLSADSIIRLSGHKKSGSVSQDIAQSGLGPTQEQSAAAKKNEKAKSKHRRQISGSISKADWTQKIYVLVTSGYLLQYSGEGSFDRLPEKMMQLGKDSVAFASDVIPGKHWVLQISQAMDSAGTPAPDPRSLLSRLTFRGADYRRTATSLLLILDSAEDMESWISTVRREIEALGGKKYVSETGKPKVDDKVLQLESQPSHRYLIQRDPDRVSPSPQTLTFKAPWNHSPERTTLELARPIYSSSSTVGPAAERLSIATSITSDGQHLDSLRESNYRLSYMSSGERTLVTSRGSSPSWSPLRETFPGREEHEFNEEQAGETQLRPNALAISERRRSMQTLHHPAFEFHATTKPSRPRPHSTYTSSAVPGQNAQHLNQPIPNFSVTYIANKRSSLARIPDNPLPPDDNVFQTPNKPKEPPVKASRKSPPAMLQARSLSPVEDQPSPPVVPTPTEFTSHKWQEHRPVVASIPPRPQTSPQRELPHVERPHRFSNLAPMNAAALSHIDFQFPPRRSSIHSCSLESRDVPPLTGRPSPRVPVSIEIPELVPLPPSPPTKETHARQSILYEPPMIQAMPPSAAKKLPRRPASMQFTTSAITPKSPNFFPSSKSTLTSINPRPSLLPNELISKSATTSPTFVNTSTISTHFTRQALPTPPLSSSLLSPTFQRLKSYSTTKQPLANRRSMPQLVNGPPPAPPPNCALPPLPGGDRSPRMGASSMRRSNVRNSVRA